MISTLPALRLTEPVGTGPLTVFPVLGPPPGLVYEVFATAAPKGFALTEVADGAQVGTLEAHNPLAVGVLLVEGEQVVGAQQDRTLDVSVLVAPGARVRVPVSCVERGRWDGRRHRERFRPAPEAAYPELRRAKAAAARRHLAAGLAPHADQGEVWAHVDGKAGDHGAPSATDRMGDVFAHREREVERLVEAAPLAPGQVGSLVALGGRIRVLDLVSRPEAYASLHPALVRGYALDALDHEAAPRPALAEAEAWLACVLAAPADRRPGVGLGEEVRFAARDRSGSGLAVGDELVHLTAFAEPAAA